ncbi:thioredoxin domain-containing protein 6 isoform X2 [Dasypus novemcinctus]|uniref:thioredoxin domain-containing protein 6 isoform X2 n=1 Tax=Dasypus novemcinctus TaxID=9361 RepID=UPI00265F5647|nr:thioredoxin domain-containing protein 6 isoform X2 [Dasypus novemcinctus]
MHINISTQELWEEMLSSKGLTVVDVHQGWCGPCKPVVSLFQKMRAEVGLDLLHFALAEADSLDVLEKYRGKCEPTFLFYAGGELVAVVRGANAPLLQKTILDQLEAEKKVLTEGKDRKVIQDEALSHEDKCFSYIKGSEDEEVVSSEKACTLAIIKPDAVVHGKTEIMMKIQEAGFEILASEERTMSETEMRLFYQHRAGEAAFETLVTHMCSGPSHLLILARTEDSEDVISTWQTLMGPCDPAVARREQPDSLRAQYGTELPFNAVHGSQDREDARRELALFFPSFRFPEGGTKAPQEPHPRRHCQVACPLRAQGPDGQQSSERCAPQAARPRARRAGGQRRLPEDAAGRLSGSCCARERAAAAAPCPSSAAGGTEASRAGPHSLSTRLSWFNYLS